MWDFTDYSKKDLTQILSHIEALEKLGIEQDSDMVIELKNELKRKNEKYLP